MRDGELERDPTQTVVFRRAFESGVDDSLRVFISTERAEGYGKSRGGVEIVRALSDERLVIFDEPVVVGA